MGGRKPDTPCTESSNGLRERWNLKNRFVVGYSGNIGIAHEFNTLLEAAEELRNNTQIVFLIIGNGVKLRWLKAETTRRQLTNIQFRPYQPCSVLRQSLSVPDVHIVSLRRELEGLVVPSKFYGIAAVGRPLIFIGELYGEFATIVNNEEFGFAVEPGKSTELAQKILALSQNTTLCKKMGYKARRVFEKNYDKSISLRAWDEVLLSA